MHSHKAVYVMWYSSTQYLKTLGLLPKEKGERWLHIPGKYSEAWIWDTVLRISQTCESSCRINGVVFFFVLNQVASNTRICEDPVSNLFTSAWFEELWVSQCSHNEACKCNVDGSHYSWLFPHSPSVKLSHSIHKDLRRSPAPIFSHPYDLMDSVFNTKGKLEKRPLQLFCSSSQIVKIT